MANAIKWEAAWTSRSSVLSTELNNLADTARTAAGTEVPNQTNLDVYAKLELAVTFGSAASATGFVTLYMITAPGGTNYADGDASNDPGGHTVVAVLPTRATTAHRLMSPVFRLEPGKTKFLLLNNAGVAFPASGSTVTLYTANEEIQ